MNQNGRWNVPRTLALLWLVVVLVIAAHQWKFWQAPALDTDVFALLPQDEQVPAAQLAMKRLAEQGERRVVVAISASDWTATQGAAQRFGTTLIAQQAGLRVTPVTNGMDKAVSLIRRLNISLTVPKADCMESLAGSQHPGWKIP
jgi:predicted exporter